MGAAGILQSLRATKLMSDPGGIVQQRRIPWPSLDQDVVVGFRLLQILPDQVGSAKTVRAATSSGLRLTQSSSPDIA